MKRFLLVNLFAVIVGIGALMCIDGIATAQVATKDRIIRDRLPPIISIKDKKDLPKDKKAPPKDKKEPTKDKKEPTKDKKEPTKDKKEPKEPKEPKKPGEVLNTIKDIIQTIRGPGQGGIGGGSGGDFGGGGSFPSDPPATTPFDPQPFTPPAPPSDVVDPKPETPQDVPAKPFDEPKDTAKPEFKDTGEEGEREQVFTRRFVKVKNDTEATIMVYIQFRGLENKKWAWVPSNPSDAQDALVFELKAGQERYLPYKNEKISASRMRLWGVANGQNWMEYRDKDLWAVPETDARGEHRYLGVEIQTFTHIFTTENAKSK